jgi:hypothetical protein
LYGSTYIPNKIFSFSFPFTQHLAKHALVVGTATLRTEAILALVQQRCSCCGSSSLTSLLLLLLLLTLLLCLLLLWLLLLLLSLMLTLLLLLLLLLMWCAVNLKHVFCELD